MTDAELRAVEEVIARLREGVPLHDVAPGLDPSLVELGALLAGELTETGWGTAAAVPAGFDAVWESVAVLGGVGASGAAAAAGGGAAAAGGGGASAGAAGGGTAGASAVGAAAAGTAGTAGVGGATGILGGIAGVVGGLGATTTALVATAVVAGAVAAGVLLGGDDADPDAGHPDGDGVVQPADPEATEPLDPDLGDSLWSAPSPDDGPDDARGPRDERATGGDPLAPSVPADPAPTELAPPGTAGPSTSVGPPAAPDDGPPASSADPGPSSPPAGPADPPPEAPVDPVPPAPPGPPSRPGPSDPPGPPGSPEPPAPPDPPDEPGDPAPPAPPVAVGGSASIRSGDVHVFDVLGVDGGDPLVVAGGAELDHDSLSVVAGSGPGHGSVQVESGTLVYTPAPFWIGHDSFRFRVCDVTGEASGCTEGDLEVTTGRRVEHLEQNLPGQPTFTFSFAPHRDPGTATFPDVPVCASEEAGQCLVTQEGDDVWRWFGPPGQLPGGYPFVLVVHVDGWATEADGPGPTGVSYELRITLTHVSSGGRAGAEDPVLVL